VTPSTLTQAGGDPDDFFVTGAGGRRTPPARAGSTTGLRGERQPAAGAAFSARGSHEAQAGSSVPSRSFHP
jgi:hypothetical protein